MKGPEHSECTSAFGSLCFIGSKLSYLFISRMAL